MKRPVMIMAGGTGGHIFPALAVAEQLRAEGEQVVWMGTHKGLEAKLVPKAGIEMAWISIDGVRGQGKLALLKAPFKLLHACWQAWRALRRHRPSLVLGMGGFVAGPGGLMSWLSRRPLLIHEQNAVAGLTNRLLAPFATQLLEAFEGAFASKYSALCTGNPLRSEVTGIPSPAERFAGRDGALRILVVGGSQGALVFNSVLPKQLAALQARGVDLQIRHQCGAKGVEVAQRGYADISLNVSIEPFIEDMAVAYGWADLVICRAGAMTIAELAAVGVASLLVPLPSAADDHQTLNARYLEQGGAALLVPQLEFIEDNLVERLQALAKRDTLQTMAERARDLAKAAATAEVVAICRRYQRGEKL